MRFITILRPDYAKNYAGQTPSLTDYVSVPRLSLRGRYRVRDLVAPEQMGMLARFANKLEKQRKTI